MTVPKVLNELAERLSVEIAGDLARRDGARMWDALGDRRAEALNHIADAVFESIDDAVCDSLGMNDGPDFDEDGYERAALPPEIEGAMNLVGVALRMFVLRQVDAERRRAAKAAKAAAARRARLLQ